MEEKKRERLVLIHGHIRYIVQLIQLHTRCSITLLTVTNVCGQRLMVSLYTLASTISMKQSAIDSLLMSCHSRH